MKRTAVPLAGSFVPFQFRHRYYFQQTDQSTVLPFSVNRLRSPNIDKKFLHPVYTDESMDMRDKEFLDMSEAIRNPRERDFYQDHTYNNMWIQRDYDKKQEKQLAKYYDWMMPGYQIEPWIWYPGDQVEIVTGEYQGQRGQIMTIVKYKNQMMVQNVNVQAINIPATETRPEHTVQREHPVPVTCCQHIDPSTNAPGTIRLITVRDKESGELKKQRIFLGTGVILPIPEENKEMDSDPLHDTPLEDAEELTYDRETEHPVMVERKLKAMEDHFVDEMKQSHEFHDKLSAENTEALQMYQHEVWVRAKNLALKAIAKGARTSAMKRSAAAAAAGSHGDGVDLGDEMQTPPSASSIPRATIKPFMKGEIKKASELTIAARKLVKARIMKKGRPVSLGKAKKMMQAAKLEVIARKKAASSGADDE